MLERTPLIGDEAVDTETGRAVWWDGIGWSYTRPQAGAGSNSSRPMAARSLPWLQRQVRPDRIPLSSAQRRLWFIDRLEGASLEYNMPHPLRLRGRLNRHALQKAIDAIVERHESLRTRFEEVDGEPVQVIEPKLKIEIPLEDLSGLDSPYRQELAAKAIRQEWEQPFDLQLGPVLRMKLLKLADDDHILLRTMHHIVSDAWSQGIFNREFMLLYEAFCQNLENPLRPLPLQYADFTLWQLQCLEDQQSMQYWKAQLSGIPEWLELPADRPRPEIPALHSGVCNPSLTAEHTLRLKRLSQKNQATLYMTLLAAFAVLLARYSGQDDIVVGTPIANRQDPQLEELIGIFANSLVMRLRVAPQMTFNGFLKEVRNTALEAYEHQDVPFERLVEELSPRRALNIAPIFQVFFALQNAPMSAQQLKGLHVEAIGGDELLIRYDLEITAWERDGQVRFLWLYNRDLFEQWRMEQMAEHYMRVLEWVIRGGGQPLRSLEMLSAAERRMVLEEWNGRWEQEAETGGEEGEETVVDLFEEQAETKPEQPALVSDENEMSYAELNVRANRLAHVLIGKGVGTEDIIGVCVGRGMEMAVCLLGILKAGAAYLPLDSKYPAERLRMMVEDPAPVCVLAEEKTAEGVPKGAGVLLLDSEEMRKELGTSLTSNPQAHERVRRLHSGNAAYVIYTSGSTGRPKGTLIEHRSAAEMVRWGRAVYGEELQGVLASTSICFDLSVFELYVTWSCGGTVMLVENLLELASLTRRERVRLINTVPSAMAELMRMEGLPAGVEVVNLAGEAIGKDLVEQVYSAGHVKRVYNLYGPTEDTTYSTRGLMNRDGNNVGEIGRPLWKRRAYVLGKNLEEAPAGVAGELYLAGQGLARGYLKRAGLTAERFVACPYGMGGERMYRTGDLARWGAAGNLEFLGRSDQQVKIRGFRIELGEIEATLVSHPGVKQAVVVVHAAENEEKRLLAYCVLALGNPPSESELRNHLQQKLPSYMVPSGFVRLESLPLTSSGKVARNALREFGTAMASPAAVVPPQDELQRTIALAWEQVLHKNNLSIFDNFFDVGGHSLLAIRVHRLLGKLMPGCLELVDLFKYPTIAALAKFLAESGQEQQPSGPQQSEELKRRERSKTGRRDRFQKRIASQESFRGNL